jgi:DDE superfamily endonuclease
MTGMDNEEDGMLDLLSTLDDDDDDDGDRYDLLVSLAFVIAAATLQKNCRPWYHVRERLEWGEHVRELFAEGPRAFPKMYRMEYESFVKLCNIIRPIMDDMHDVTRDATGRPITTEIALHCLIRWLAGSSYIDIRIIAGISVSSFYLIKHKCLLAIIRCPELQILFPTTTQEIIQAAANFKTKSNNHVVDGCVGCLDGILLKIQTPNPNETGNVKAYFSGHYQQYGINVQAICDHHCRFTHVSIAAPGGTNDIAAYRKTTLPDIIEKLPRGYFVIGDNAYVCTEHLLTPFCGNVHYKFPFLKLRCMSVTY